MPTSAPPAPREPHFTHWNDDEAAASARASYAEVLDTDRRFGPVRDAALERLHQRFAALPNAERRRLAAERRQITNVTLPWTDPAAEIPVPIPAEPDDVGAWLTYGEDFDVHGGQFLVRPLMTPGGRAAHHALVDRLRPCPARGRARERWRGRYEAELCGFYCLAASRRTADDPTDPFPPRFFRAFVRPLPGFRAWLLRVAADPARFVAPVPVRPVLRAIIARLDADREAADRDAADREAADRAGAPAA